MAPRTPGGCRCRETSGSQGRSRPRRLVQAPRGRASPGSLRQDTTPISQRLPLACLQHGCCGPSLPSPTLPWSIASAKPTAPQPPPRSLCCPSSPTSSPFPQERSFQLQRCPATLPRAIQSPASPHSPQILFLLLSPSISPTTWVSGDSPNVPAEPLPRTLSPQSFHVWGRSGFRSQLKWHLLRGASPTSPAKGSHQSLALTSLDCNFCTASTSVCHFPVCLLFIYCQPLSLEI